MLKKTWCRGPDDCGQLLFTSDRDKKLLSECDEVSIDATFKIVRGNEEGITQLLIIVIPTEYGPHNDIHGFPAAFILMKGAEKANYTAAYIFFHKPIYDKKWF